MTTSSSLRISYDREYELKEMDRSPQNHTTIAGSPKAATPHRASPPPSETPTVIDRTLSSATNLVNLLPTGTVLAFQTLSPSFTNKGSCYTSNKYLTWGLLLLCTLSAFFFSFTDSFIGTDKKHYFGIATMKGFYVFNYEGAENNRSMVFMDLRRYRIRLLDCIHAFFSMVVFLTITFSDSDIRSCFFPHAGNNIGQLLVNLPLGAGVLSSFVFMMFPTSRKGIGYSNGALHAS